MSGPMESMEKMIPSVDDVTFWLVVNAFLFLWVGIAQVVYGSFLGAYYAYGAIFLGFLYVVFLVWVKNNRKMALQSTILISGLAVLGDLVVIAAKVNGSFSGTSALLDFAGLMLLHAAYRATKSS